MCFRFWVALLDLGCCLVLVVGSVVTGVAFVGRLIVSGLRDCL